MALAPLKLPRLQIRLPIVANAGTPTTEFHRLLNQAFERIEGQVNDIIAVQAALAQAQQDILDVQTDQASQLATINALLGITQANSAAAQAAQQAANTAQATADAAGGTGTSGSATNPSVTISDFAGWVNGPLVSLTGVVAGTLTITGSGPQQDSDVALSFPGTFEGEWRVQEIISGVETTVFTGGLTAYQGDTDPIASVYNTSSGDVAAFSSPRASTGAVDYRLDARAQPGEIKTLSDLNLYLFARRAT